MPDRFGTESEGRLGCLMHPQSARLARLGDSEGCSWWATVLAVKRLVKSVSVPWLGK